MFCLEMCGCAVGRATCSLLCPWSVSLLLSPPPPPPPPTHTHTCQYASTPRPQVFNASEEEALADKYPNIRLFTAALKASDTPVQELLAVEQPWSVASSSKYLPRHHPLNLFPLRPLSLLVQRQWEEVTGPTSQQPAGSMAGTSMTLSSIPLDWWTQTGEVPRWRRGPPLMPWPSVGSQTKDQPQFTGPIRDKIPPHTSTQCSGMQ